MLTLRHRGGDSLVVAPEQGGAIVGWTNPRTSLLRHPLPEAVIGHDTQAMGGFPLVPYCNRIAYGRFRWDGQTHQLALNFGDHPHSIHGVGWQRAWTVEAASDTAVTLSLRHTAQGIQSRGWPFAFIAELTYALTDDGLAVTLRAINRHPAAVPLGLGLHPYFPRRAGSALRFEADGVWRNGPDSLPQQHDRVPPEWEHGQGLAVATHRLDNCFTGWASPASLLAGPGSLALSADPLFRNLQVFTPPWTDFYCVEPVSHAPDAINRTDLPPDQSMRVVPPGEALSGTIRLLHERDAASA